MPISKDKIIDELYKTEKTEVWSFEKIKLELSKLDGSQGEKKRDETRPGDVLSQRGRPCREKAAPGPGSPKVEKTNPPQTQTEGKAEHEKRRPLQKQTRGKAILDGA